MLDGQGACALAAAMQGVDPEKLGAAAVPLAIALMQYEWGAKDQVSPNPRQRCQGVLLSGGGTTVVTIACMRMGPAHGW